MVDRTASRPQRSWRTSSAHARRCSTSSTARARTLPTRPPTPPTLTTSRTSVRSCRPHPPTRKQQCCHHLSRPCAVPRVDSLPAGVGARPRGRERRARGRARTAQRRDQHARVAAHRAGQRARAPRPRGGHGCLRFNSLPHQPFWFFPALSLSLSLSLSLMCVHAWRWKQAQRGLHELYATVADINAQEEGLPPAAKAREPAPSTKVPVKRPRESSAAASPAPALAPVPAPAVSPAVQAPLQQRAPVAPTPAPDLHIDDDSSFSTQFVVFCLSLFLCVHRCALSQRKTCCSRVLDGTVGAESHVRNLCIVVLHAMTMCVPITHIHASVHTCPFFLPSSFHLQNAMQVYNRLFSFTRKRKRTTDCSVSISLFPLHRHLCRARDDTRHRSIQPLGHARQRQQHIAVIFGIIIGRGGGLQPQLLCSDPRVLWRPPRSSPHLHHRPLLQETPCLFPLIHRRTHAR